jgi:hypothetical protein
MKNILIKKLSKDIKSREVIDMFVEQLLGMATQTR